MKPFVTILLAALWLTVSAQEFESKGITYRVLSPSEKTCEVIAARDTIYIDIPARVIYNNKEYRVVQIGEKSMSMMSMLMEIHLNEGLRFIGADAFAYTQALRDVNFPASLDSIAPGAFYQCFAIKSLSMDRPVRLAPTAFDFDVINLYVPWGQRDAFLRQPNYEKWKNIGEEK